MPRFLKNKEESAWGEGRANTNATEHKATEVFAGPMAVGLGVISLYV